MTQNRFLNMHSFELIILVGKCTHEKKIESSVCRFSPLPFSTCLQITGKGCNSQTLGECFPLFQSYRCLVNSGNALRDQTSTV